MEIAIKIKRLCFLSLSIIYSFSCNAQMPEITQPEVEKTIKVLASDEMLGRHIDNPGLRKASDFIVSQFNKAGLEKLDELEGYKQQFEIYSSEMEKATVTINGTEISSENYFVISNSESFDWDQENEIEIKRVINNEKARQTMFSTARGSEDALVLVDQSLSNLFGRFKAFFSRGNRFMKDEEGANVVFILTNSQPESFTVNVKNSLNSIQLNNVVGLITGKRKNEYVIFSAHYDHIGIRPPVEGDSIANGANDNASGTTAVIHLAKYYSQLPQPERSLIFVAFTAEEMGGFGSRYFSQQLNPDQIVAMFNIEMIGKPARDGPNSAWITGFDKSDFGSILAQSVEGTQYRFYADPYPDQNLFYRSDNATLARLGVPAHSISTTPIDVDTDYHQVSDEVETLDLGHMTNTIKAIVAGAESIISGKATPTRIDPQQVRN